MEDIPSPLERLLHLEHALEQLQSERAMPGRQNEPPAGTTPPRHPWPADELLLTRLLRRSPQALGAYEAPAELTESGRHDLRLTESPTGSPFRFCELADGDAAVWVDSGAASWVWESSCFLRMFRRPEEIPPGTGMVLQRLPVFKPLARGRSWTLFSPGEMAPRHGPFPESAEQGRMLRRLESLERRFGQEMGRLRNELEQLRAQLRVQQDLLDRLLRVQVPGQGPSPQREPFST